MTITGNARVAGIIGWPVSHSLSPILHGHWLERYGIDGAYIPLAITPEDFGRAVRALPALGFRGVNVTVPHKEAALVAVDEADETARRIGAVNTIIIGEDDRLEGRNTDAFGFRESLRDDAPAFDATSGPAVVLGAGGAARALVAALLDAGAPAIRIVNRTMARAEALAKDLGGPCEIFGAGETAQAFAGAALMVNSTSLGMAGQPPLDIDLAPLPATALVVDIVYQPLETVLLSEANGRGNPVVNGLGMLLHQARPGFEAWFGVAPEVTPELRAAVLAGGKE